VLSRDSSLTRLVEYPVQHFHALAVMRFVEGQPLDWGADGSLALVGKTLGTIHRALLGEASLELQDQLFSYLANELQPRITRAIDGVRSFEARHPVTYGPIYGDGLQVRINPNDTSVDVIDWGTVSAGPLAFDLALAAEGARRAGHRDLSQLWASYLELGMYGRKNWKDLPTTKR
jgi:Ser/Thr protein kinase RdoA (MazF antagonist)